MQFCIRSRLIDHGAAALLLLAVGADYLVVASPVRADNVPRQPICGDFAQKLPYRPCQRGPLSDLDPRIPENLVQMVDIRAATLRIITPVRADSGPPPVLEFLSLSVSISYQWANCLPQVATPS